MEEIGLLTSWDSFVKALQVQLGASSYDDTIKALISLKQ
jgi:hypothetical protein